MTIPTSSAEISYPPGSIIADKYRVERPLGVGGMGAVLEASHVHLGHRVALKVLHPGAVGAGDAVPRFLREARATAALESEHVVRIFDIGTTPDGMPFLVMERLMGLDLDEVLSQIGALPVGLAIECLYQAAQGVREAHGAGIIHRDLKPSNLFLTRKSSGQPLLKVLDFGISKLQHDVQNVRLTETRTIVGSPQYMSPEQVRDARAVSERSDIWALGAILHELLDGRPAFTGDTLPSVCASIVSDEPAVMRRQDIPTEVDDVRLRCLVKNPAERIGSAEELISILEPLRKLIPAAALDRLPLQFPERSTRESVVSLETSLGDRAIHSQATIVDTKDAIQAPRQDSGIRPAASPPTLNSATITTDGDRDADRSGRRWFALSALALLVLGSAAAWMWNSGTPSSETITTQASVEQKPLEKMGALQITSTPLGALITEHDRVLGQTPARLEISFDEYRSRELELRLDGYHPHLLTVSEQNLGRPIEVMLIPLPEPEKTAPPEKTAEQAPPEAVKTAPLPRVKTSAPKSRPKEPQPATAPSDILMSR